jgi:hypothetical protein
MTAVSGKVLQDALVTVRAVMKAKLFRCKGLTFHRIADAGNTMLLSLQKSQSSSSSASSVTINFGVYSKLIGHKLGDEEAAAIDVKRVHWRKRLSRADGREQWITIKSTDSASVVASMLISAIEDVLPDLNEHAGDEALRDTWLSGFSHGLTAMQRLLYLAILVSEIGPADRLAPVVSELRRLVAGGIHEGLIEQRLARAGIQVSA